MKSQNHDNEFDQLMATLLKHNIVAYVRNCDVGMLGGTIPATFSYGFSAMILWTRAPHMSRRQRSEAGGQTATEALKNVIRQAGLEERISRNPA